MVFAEAFASISKRQPDLIKPERIVFVRARVDRKRETPCLVVSDIIGIDEAPARLTTMVGLKLDGNSHNVETMRQIKPLLIKHKGNLPVYAQVDTNDGRKVVLQLAKDLSVRPTGQFVEEVDRLLGAGTVQLYGDGQRRLKRLQQQALFKEAEQAVESTEQPSDEQAAQQMDEEEMLQDA
jgi:hypothetical protein